jgi:transposase
MKCYVGCDAHKRYSVFVIVDEHCRASRAQRVEHDREQLREYLRGLPTGTEIAVETTGNWYWLVDEMEQAGHRPRLTDAKEAKKRMGKTNKTDRLDARGLAILLRNETLPEVWIPPGELRDQRELLRTRMTLRDQRTELKNRVHAALAKYGLRTEGISDLFGKKGRQYLQLCEEQLPEQTRYSVEQQLGALDRLGEQLEEMESRIQQVVEETPAVRLLRTMPGVGLVLAPVMALEIGDVDRFPSAAHLASYAGLVPRVRSSGGHTVRGRVGQEVNRYLKWAFVEAANAAVMHQKKYSWRHVVRLYRRLQPAKGHGKAAVAVGRHLAEAAYWILHKQQEYLEPRVPQKSSKLTTVVVAASSAHG